MVSLPDVGDGDGSGCLHFQAKRGEMSPEKYSREFWEPGGSRRQDVCQRVFYPWFSGCMFGEGDGRLFVRDGEGCGSVVCEGEGVGPKYLGFNCVDTAVFFDFTIHGVRVFADGESFCFFAVNCDVAGAVFTDEDGVLNGNVGVFAVRESGPGPCSYSRVSGEGGSGWCHCRCGGVRDARTNTAGSGHYHSYHEYEWNQRGVGHTDTLGRISE